MVLGERVKVGGFICFLGVVGREIVGLRSLG